MGNTLSPVVKILPEAARFNLPFQVAVRRRDNPSVDLARALVPDTLKGPFLQDAQQLALQIQGDLTDFVKKKGSAVG